MEQDSNWKTKLEAALDLCHKNLIFFLRSCMFDTNFVVTNVENPKFLRFLELVIVASDVHLQRSKRSNISPIVREDFICFDEKIKFSSNKLQSHEADISLAVDNFNEQFPFFAKKYLYEAGFNQFETDYFHPAYYFLVSKIIDLEIELLSHLKALLNQDPKISSLVRCLISPTFFQSLQLITQTRTSDIYSFSTSWGKKVLKVLRSSSSSKENIQKLDNELEVSQKISLPAFRKALMITNYQNRKALLLDWIEGKPLNDMIFNVPDFLNIAKEIVSAMVSMHASNIMHLNLTCEHIIQNSEDKTIKIIGIGSCSTFSSRKTYLTYPNHLEKDLRYVSPEQTGRNNRVVDFRSDFYCLGVMFYRLLTGKFPFESKKTLKLIHMHILQNCIPVKCIKDDVPVPVSDMISKLMEMNAENRYQSAKGIIYDLDLMISEYKRDTKLSSVILAKHDISETLILPQDIYGRASEYEIMISALDKACTGSFELLFVTGMSGIGKTELVMELFKPLAQRKGFLSLGKYDSSNSSPYSAILEAAKNLCDMILMEEAVTIEIYRSKIQEAVGEEGGILTNVIPNLHLIIGRQPSLDHVFSSFANNRFNFVFIKFFRSICSIGRPITLILENLQWCDEESLKLLSNLLLDKLSNLLFIGIYRDDEVHAGHPLVIALKDIEAKKSVTKIKLSNLNHEVITELVSDTFCTNLIESFFFVALIMEKTKGNPLSVKQFLTSLYQQKMIYFCFQDRKWKWDHSIFNKADIADNALQLLRENILTLEDSTQHTLQVASCIGNTFSLPALRPLVSHENAIEEALSTGMIIKSKESCTTYKFGHYLIKEAVLSLLPDTKKKEIMTYIVQR